VSTATDSRKPGQSTPRSSSRRLYCYAGGAAIYLVLKRPRQSRSQFVFTQIKGREAIFWQTQKTARAANPGGRIPRRRSITNQVTIVVDTRERYPYRFARQGATMTRAAVTAGDYAVLAPDGTILATVERKSLDNLASTLSDGTLAFQLQRLTELPVAAIVVEARYGALFKLEHFNGNWLADQLARLHVRYPEVQITFADTRPHAEDWTYRFLPVALADSDADE
jgi:hypothetical protein